ncbi:hypothetical protein DFJ74DRAFT_714168 [Hyaloraphidium curvatum]|nr:hypothetical protein DFJ74DRAFT_714168 [Hyaloraphidium curvatum]
MSDVSIPEIGFRERQAFVGAMFSTGPPDISILSGAAFLELNGPEPPAAHPALREFYTADIMVAVVDWLGAYALLAASAAGVDVGAAVDGALVERLEARFDSLLRRELAAFWEAAPHRRPAKGAPAAPPQPHLRTPRCLALQWAAILAASGVYLHMMRIDAAKAILSQLADIWRAAGLPSPPRGRPPPPEYGADDLLMDEIGLNVFYAACFFGVRIGPVAGTRAVLDPAAAFPDVPVALPSELVHRAVPPPSRRRANGPVPEVLAECMLRTRGTCRDLIGWLDPNLSPPVDPAVRAGMLGTYVTDLKYFAAGRLWMMVALAFRQVHELRRFVADEAGLSMLELFVAGELRRAAAAGGDPGAGDHPALADLDPARVRAALANPLLGESLRRLAFLSEAVGALTAALPPGLSAAFRSADFAALDAECPYFSGDASRVQLLAELMDLWRVRLLLVSPDQVEDDPGPRLRGDSDSESDSGSDSGSDSEDGEEAGDGGWDGSGDNTSDASGSASVDGPPGSPRPPAASPDGTDTHTSALRRLYFSSPAFSSAFLLCAETAAISRAIARSIPRPALAGSILVPIACFAAAHAAWLLVLVAKRLPAPSGEAEAGAYAALREDIRACFALLDATDRAAHAELRLMLERFLSSPRASLSRADFSALYAAQRAASGCPHVPQGERGACWACAAERARGGTPDPEGGGDRLAELPAYGPGRRVRFGGEVQVAETWGSEEYGRGADDAEGEQAGGREMAGSGVEAAMATLLGRLRMGYERARTGDEGAGSL